MWAGGGDEVRAGRPLARLSCLGFRGLVSEVRPALFAQGTGLNLKVIEPVRMAASQQLDEAGCRVRQEKHHALTLVLSHVFLFMGTQLAQRVFAAPQHDMAQGDGAQVEARASLARQGDLQHPGVEVSAATQEQDGCGQQHADERARGCPRIPEKCQKTAVLSHGGLALHETPETPMNQ